MHFNSIISYSSKYPNSQICAFQIDVKHTNVSKVHKIIAFHRS